MNSRALVLFSGGKDSTIALWWARRVYRDVVALSIDYSGRPRKERAFTRALCQRHSIPLIDVEIDFLQPFGLMKAEEVTTRRQGYIPMRNLIFYATAGHFADIRNCSAIVGGHVRSDGVAHADASPQFFRHLVDALNVAISGSFVPDQAAQSARTPLVVALPLHELTDAEAIKLGWQLSAPIEETWSCWHNDDVPCGRCVSCNDRKLALSAAAKLPSVTMPLRPYL